MKYNSLLYFLRLAETEHYTNAAKDLYISQPSLSYAISALEEELGVPLFEKNGRNVRLTKYGKIFYDHVSEGVKKIGEGVELMHQFSNAGVGTINFAYIYILGTALIPQLVSKFKEIPAYSDLHFVFGQGNSLHIIDNVKKGIYDMAITAYVRDEGGISFTPILKQKMVLIVPPDHAFAQRERVSPEDLLDQPLITYNTFTNEIRRMIDGIFAPYGRMPRIMYEFEEEMSIATAVMSSNGVAIVPDVAALRLSPVKKIALAGVDLYRELYLIRAKSRYLSASSEAFYHFILSLDLSELV